MPYIAREATRIVGRFSLPEDIHPRQLITLLAETIEKGKTTYRDCVKKAIRSKGYEEVFPELLDQAADRVIRHLKQVLPERNQAS